MVKFLEWADPRRGQLRVLQALIGNRPGWLPVGRLRVAGRQCKWNASPLGRGLIRQEEAHGREDFKPRDVNAENGLSPHCP